MRSAPLHVLTPASRRPELISRHRRRPRRARRRIFRHFPVTSGATFLPFTSESRASSLIGRDDRPTELSAAGRLIPASCKAPGQPQNFTAWRAANASDRPLRHGGGRPAGGQAAAVWRADSPPHTEAPPRPGRRCGGGGAAGAAGQSRVDPRGVGAAVRKGTVCRCRQGRAGARAVTGAFRVATVDGGPSRGAAGAATGPSGTAAAAGSELAAAAAPPDMSAYSQFGYTYGATSSQVSSGRPLR